MATHNRSTMYTHIKAVVLLLSFFTDHSASAAGANTNDTAVDGESSYHHWTLEAWSLAQASLADSAVAATKAIPMHERRLAVKINPFAKGAHASKGANTHAAAPAGLSEGAYPPVLAERPVPSANAEASFTNNGLSGADSASAARIYAPPWWLRREVTFAKSELAFGLFSPSTTQSSDVRLDLIALWWLSGSSGCLFREAGSSVLATEQLRRRGLHGLELCTFPPEVLATPWYGSSTSTGFALAPLLLLHKFPRRMWYVVGDDDTLFNPLALSQWLTNFAPEEPWYLGGRSESVETRKHTGWDSAVGGAGIALSGRFLRDSHAHLARCYDAAPWKRAVSGGGWVLHRCLSRLGVPLTPCGGFHQADERDPTFLRHLLEDHPVAPFLALKHHPFVFSHQTKLAPAPFFEAMSRDPIAFLSTALLEVQRGHASYTASVSQGLSVRLWPGKRLSQLWQRLRSEAISPPPHFTKRKDVRADTGIGPPPGIRYAFSRAQHQSISGDTLLTVYLPDKSSNNKGGGNSEGDSSSSGNDDGPHVGEMSSEDMLNEIGEGLLSGDDGALMTVPRPQSSSSSTNRLGANIGGGIIAPNPPFPNSPPKGGNGHGKKGLGHSSLHGSPHPGGGGGMSSSKGGGGIGGVGNSVVRSSSSDDEFPGVTIVPSNSGMRRQLLGATFKKAPLGDTDDELVDGFIEGRVEGRKMKTWKSSESIYEQKKQEEEQLHEQQSRSRKRSRRQLQESGRFPWSMVVVVEERVPNSPGLLVGSPRNLCHLATHEIVFTSSHGDGPSALILRLRDCRLRGVVTSKASAPGAKEVLGGLTGSTLADLLEQGGGPRNEWSGMRERENRAPLFPFLPVGEAQPPPPVGSFHPDGRRLFMKDGEVQEEGSLQRQQLSNGIQNATQSSEGIEPTLNLRWAPSRWNNDLSTSSNIVSSRGSGINDSNRTSSSQSALRMTHINQPAFSGLNESQSALRRRRLGGGATKDKHLLGNSEDEKNKNCKYVPWKMKVVCSDTPLPPTEGNNFETGNKKWKEKNFAPPAGANAVAVSGGDGDNSGGGNGNAFEGAGKQHGNRLSDDELLASKRSGLWRKWLSDEHRMVTNDVAWGVITSQATAPLRLPLLRLWWMPNMPGCLSSDHPLSPALIRQHVPQGLVVCEVPPVFAHKPWMKAGKKGRGLHRGALMPAILRLRFPHKPWYVVGDDDSMFSPLTLGQWLTNFDASQIWYLGGRSEDLKARANIGWDMAFGGAGIVLSGGFFDSAGLALEKCYDQAPWAGGAGGDWVLFQCLKRLGVPLTASGGFHQVDDRTPQYVRDILERHPSAPFLSLHHEDKVFKASTQMLSRPAFFASLWLDPINFLQLTVVDVRSSSGGASAWTGAIASGLSVRLWPTSHARSGDSSNNDGGIGGLSSGRRGQAAEDVLWSDQARTEAVVPPSADLRKEHAAEIRYMLALDSTGSPLSPDSHLSGKESRGADSDLLAVRVYAPPVATETPLDEENGEARQPLGTSPFAHLPYRLVVVLEEQWPKRWRGAPRKFCHSASHEARSTSRATSSGLTDGDRAVLVISLRDCRTDPRRPAVGLGKESFINLVNRAVDGAPIFEPGQAFSLAELPAGFDYLGNE